MPLPNTHEDACASCAINHRRAFVQEAVIGVAALLGFSALTGATAVAQIVALSSPAAGLRGEARYPIPPADGVHFDTKNDVIVARAGDTVYAFSLACPHQNTMLRWNAKERRFQCPKHQSRYKPSGEFISGRATRNMDRLPIQLEGTTLVVDTSLEIRSDQDAARWAAAGVKIPVSP
ncbi:MAG: Rieske (2Fe-2S) protein [Phycisphaerae bacterium]|nr:Rieske (2Fe-2S) protein [Gemmatimonadaceae bacterium]